MKLLKRVIRSGARRVRNWLREPAPPPAVAPPFDNRYDWLRAAFEDLQADPACGGRSAYIWGVLHGAALGKVLGLNAVSVLEFGVAGGAGLLAMEEIAERAERKIGIKINVFGFDTGKGLPKPLDYRDCPNIWIGEGQFPMDVAALKPRLKRASLLLGPISDTVSEYLDAKPAPVAFASVDVDLYTSTMDVFKLFDAEPDRLLPRVLCYFDDIMGLTYSDFNGERLAISEFNNTHPERKLSPLYGLKYYVPESRRNDQWPEIMYYMHAHDHPSYNDPDELRKPMVMDMDSRITGWISGSRPGTNGVA